MPHFTILAFDADDTLWHNERLYINTQARFAQLLAHYHPADWVQNQLYQTETRNIAHFGYGIKAFALSMIETAVELTEGRISGQDIGEIVGWAKEMLTARVELLDHVAETIPQLAQNHTLMVITKGDLLDQENKIIKSGLGAYFRHVEVVSHKRREDYARILTEHGIPPERFLMVGNSLKSDILPILELGGTAVYVPYETTWLHEVTDPPPAGQERYHEIEHFGQLAGLILQLENSK
jgi:putative hydrolase of the HAD superfamily